MILDELLEFCDATSVAAAAGTALVGDVIDLGANVKDFGAGAPVWLVINTDTEIITGGTAGTIQFFLCSDALATLGAGVVASCTTHVASAIYVTDDSAANSDQLNAGGYPLVVALPHGTYERYLGILVTTGTTTTTAGKINAYLTTQEPPVSVTLYAQGSDH
jgi:hypothetical protein